MLARKSGGQRTLSVCAFGWMLTVVWAGGCTSPGSTPQPPGNNDDVDLARAIEEADIVKVANGYFYLANPYKGLMIVDGQDMDHPTLSGVLPLGGRGIELFLVGERAYVFTSADFYACAGEPVGYDSLSDDGIVQPDYEGSRLWVIDVSDKTAPEVEAQFDFDGFVQATRRVGDAIYATGNAAIDLSNLQGEGVFVTSFNIADPENIVEADSVDFAAYVENIHVSTEAIYVYGPDPTVDDTSLISLVDISDPTGDLLVRDQFRVPGEPVDRYALDERDGTLRVVTERFDRSRWVRKVELYIYDVSNPDDIDRLSDLELSEGYGSLEAARFDGDRAYVVAAWQDEPMMILDLSDPNDPVVAGTAEVPGSSTHIVPAGDRLYAVGYDSRWGYRPSVAMYDVSDPADVRRLSSIIVGDLWSYDTESEATVDEKALRVLEDEGLILLPFSTYDRDEFEYVEALQIIEITPTILRERGLIEHTGRVRRTNIEDDRLWVLSDLAFQSLDIDDLDAPESLAAIELIDEQELLDAGLINCVDSLRYWGTPLYYYYGGSSFFCGAGAVPFMTMTLAGLVGLSWRRRRQ